MNRFEEALNDLVEIPVTNNMQASFEMFARDNGMGNLYLISATISDIQHFLRVRYWYIAQCEGFVNPIDLLLFKLAIYKGVHFATQHLQATIGCVPTGAWNEFSAAALADSDINKVIYSMEFAIKGVLTEIKSKDVSMITVVL
jgi:hypothetical protein